MEELTGNNQLISKLPAAVYTCSNKGVITYFNDAAALLWGKTPNIGIDRWDSFWQLYNDNGELLPEHLRPISIVLHEKETIHSKEIVVERPDGVKYYLLSSTQPILDSNGTISGVLDMLIDITRQKNEQQVFRDDILKKNEELIRQKQFAETVLHSSADAISVYDKHTRFIALNKKFEELYTIKSESVVGKKYLEIFSHGAESTDSYDSFLKALNGEHVHKVINKSDTLDRSLEVFTIPLMHNNEVYAVLSVVHDITAVMKVSERLQITNKVLEEKNKELERSNNELASFSYIASHDLQEPLRKIITFADKLLEATEITTTKATQTYLEKIITSSERMRQLIEDVLNFSRISAEEKFTKTDLNEVVSHVLADFDQQIHEKNARLNISDLPAIPAVRLQMRQLFHNLISNALKFSNRTTPPVIQISWESLTSEEMKNYPNLSKAVSYVKIIVQDNGIGFNQEFSERIFAIFQRLHGNNEFPGTGIGLALCRKITDNHHGIIYAQSEEGQGTCFHIILPARIGRL